MKEFHSLTDLARHLGEVALSQHEMEHAALESAAVMVERRAKEKIGEYQQEAGPFIAWPELADSTKADRTRHGFAEDEPLLRTGELRDSIEHTVADGVAQVGSNSDKAVWQELGTKYMPPRSFLGGAVVDKLDDIMKTIGEQAVASLVGKGVFGGKMTIKD